MRQHMQWLGILGFALVFGLSSAGSAWAGKGPGFNGDFETGDLTGWLGFGDAGVADFNVLSGGYSAFITTGVGAVGGMCSFLLSGPIFPATTTQALKVSFKVRYKTDEGIGPYACEDPFTAELITGKGTVDLLTIKADGVTPGPGTKVQRLDTGAFLPAPPTIPPSVGEGLYADETPTLLANSTIIYTGCDPVLIKFTICDSFCEPLSGENFDSAAFLDDVLITPISGGGGAPCPPPAPVSFKRLKARK